MLAMVSSDTQPDFPTLFGGIAHRRCTFESDTDRYMQRTDHYLLAFHLG